MKANEKKHIFLMLKKLVIEDFYLKSSKNVQDKYHETIDL